jgi:RimJ/RimL family protein N-acetyltransferase
LQRVLEKCGFIKEAVFNQAICKNDKMYSEIRYAKITKKINPADDGQV